jgi:hypothetical protein
MSEPTIESAAGRSPAVGNPVEPVGGFRDGHPPFFLMWARAAAMEYHQGQVDKIGEPYIYHPARVAQACQAGRVR